MAMRKPEASVGGEQVAKDDPVLRAMMNCPLDDETIPESVRRIADNLGEEPHGTDHETMMALIALLPE